MAVADPNISKAKMICMRFDALKADRANWEQWWQDLAKYCIPRKSNITEIKESGTRFDHDVYDSTARDSVKIFVAGMMGHFTNPNQIWFRLRTEDDALMEAEGVREFFSRAEKRLRDIFTGSNFYDQLGEFYNDLGVFGTASFYTEPDPEDIIRYYARPPREILFEVDEKGRLRAVYRWFELTALQAFEQWGTNAGKGVNDAIEAKSFDKKFEFIQFVGPRGIRDPKKRDKRNMEIESIWVSLTDKKKVQEGGFEEQPFSLARFSTISGEKHGFSPAMDVLPEIKGANKQKFYILRTGAKKTDPAVMLPHEHYLLPLDFNPGAVNYKLQSAGAQSDEKIETFGNDGDINAGREVLLDDRETIKRGFFTDMFILLMDRRTKKTAHEVDKLIEEKMLILGPFLGRLQNEALKKTIIRSFNIALRAGEFGPIPLALRDNPNYKIEYLGIMARAQRFAESRSIEDFLLTVGEMANADPKVLHKINFDKMVDELAEIKGIDPKLLNTPEKVEALRQQLIAEQQMAQQLQVAQAAAQTAKTAGEASQTIQPQQQ